MRIEDTGAIVQAMIVDVEKEKTDEVVLSREARTAIGRTTAHMFHARLREKEDATDKERGQVDGLG